MDQAEVCIKTFKESSNHGFIDIQELIGGTLLLTHHLEYILNVLKEFGFTKIPAKSLVIGVKTAEATLGLLQNSKVFITNEV